MIKHHIPITMNMNMFSRCLLVLFLTVGLVQTLQCYDCSVKPTEKRKSPAGGNTLLVSAVCKDGELGELVNCSGSCLKSVLGR